jgi:hypothetical protein
MLQDESVENVSEQALRDLLAEIGYALEDTYDNAAMVHMFKVVPRSGKGRLIFEAYAFAGRRQLKLNILCKRIPELFT